MNPGAAIASRFCQNPGATRRHRVLPLAADSKKPHFNREWTRINANEEIADQLAGRVESGPGSRR